MQLQHCPSCGRTQGRHQEWCPKVNEKTALALAPSPPSSTTRKLPARKHVVNVLIGDKIKVGRTYREVVDWKDTRYVRTFIVANDEDYEEMSANINAMIAVQGRDE